MFEVIYYKNDTLLRVNGMKNAVDNSPINNATVQILSITRYNGADIDTNMFPISLVYIANSAGNYSGVLPSTLSLEPKVRYICKLRATTPQNLVAYWEFTFTCKLRME